jgi:hypothetical protein
MISEERRERTRETDVRDESYPVLLRERGDVHWGSLNHYDCDDERFKRWYWMIPPHEPLRDQTSPLSEEDRVESLRRSIGYLMPNTGGETEDDGLFVLLTPKKRVIELPEDTFDLVFGPWSKRALEIRNRFKLFGQYVPMIPPTRYAQLTSRCDKTLPFEGSTVVREIGEIDRSRDERIEAP